MAVTPGTSQAAPNPWMESTVRSIIVMLLLSLAVCDATASPPHHSVPAPVHLHGHAEPTTAVDEQGKRWPADAPLAHGMDQIRSARNKDVRSSADATALATAIDEAIAYMILNCSLPAEADAALHGVIGQLGSAANTLRSDADRQVAIAEVDAALERYTHLFDESDLNR